VAVALVIGGFEAGRKTVNAAAFASSDGTATTPPPADSVSQKKTLPERDSSPVTVRDIATVPFSELYDVLKSASRDQLLAWARDLEQMPRGPRQRAAVAAYYKSLIQVDHHAALEALSQSTNLPIRDLAEDALLKAAPESIWSQIAEALAQMRYPGRGRGREDVILNWSRVDPVAVSKFIETHPATRFIEIHPFNANQKRPDREAERVISLLTNWGEIDPSAARSWLEADGSRQTKDAFRAFLTSWGRADPAAAIDYAVANARQPNLEAAINELVYQFVRSAKEDAAKLILLLPPERAKAALKNVADITNPKEIDPNLDRPRDYRRPPDEIAPWMVSFPVEFWSDGIGVVANGWLNDDADSAKAWLNQLRPDLRDAAIASCCRSGTQNWREVIELGLTIRDDRLRDSALADLIRSFSTRREEGIEVIDELSLSEDQKTYLRRFITEGPNGR
jgi:hypothetical protein